MTTKFTFIYSLCRIIATFFGSGYFPVAPGTAGSASTLLPVACLLLFAPSLLYGFFDPIVFIPFIIILYAAGVASTSVYMRHNNAHDPKEVVIDETIGQLIALFIPMQLFSSLPSPPFELAVVLTILGFIFFRLFDILKPWPASFFDKKICNAHGVMLDDVVAGIYAGCLVTFSIWVF